MKYIKFVILLLILAGCKKSNPVTPAPVLEYKVQTVDVTVFGIGNEVYNDVTLPKFNSPDSLYAVTLETIDRIAASFTLGNLSNVDSTDKISILVADELVGELFHDIHYYLMGFDMKKYTGLPKTIEESYKILAKDSVVVPSFDVFSGTLIHDSVSTYLEAFRGTDSIKLNLHTTAWLSGDGYFKDTQAFSDTCTFRINYFYVHRVN